jgi:hypothetical protein
MIIKTYFDKSNTLIYNSEINYGLNPLTTLFYGSTGYSRYIFHFNLNYIKHFIGDKTFADVNKLRHKLTLYNAGDIDFRQMFNTCRTVEQKIADRAASFDLILFRVPVEWDGGRGHDNMVDNNFIGDAFQSNQASNWYNSKTLTKWESDDDANVGNGIYSNEFLQSEYIKYLNDDPSIIITTVHFDLGNENIEIDLTDIINSMLIDNIPNHGFCFALSPSLETVPVTPIQSVNFFTERTSTWFEPHLTTVYNENICDDRANFYLDKPNRLYLYSNIGGEPVNFTDLPSVKITGSYENGDDYLDDTLEVKQSTKGVYYTDIIVNSDDANGIVESNRMFFDVWSYNVSINGNTLTRNRVMDFTTKSGDDYYLVGNSDFLPKQLVPVIYGIKHNEQLERGHNTQLKVYIELNLKYTVQQTEISDNIYYKIYIRDGIKEIDWCDYSPVNRTFNSNYFILDVDSLLPHEYHIRIKTISNLETKTFDVLTFNVVSKQKIVW